MGTLSIMDVEKGDIRLEWNPENKEEVSQAEKAYKAAVDKGFIAARMYYNGKKGEQLTKFDKFAERILLIPPIVGG